MYQKRFCKNGWRKLITRVNFIPYAMSTYLMICTQVEKLFKDEPTEENGERVRMASFVGVMAIADLVKTTLGPKGMASLLFPSVSVLKICDS
ncbi:hypothetical protein L1887_14041 [Cichorium endivia]|nr:hypothetical protein L1887_14041 [Cichorium endivia]